MERYASGPTPMPSLTGDVVQFPVELIDSVFGDRAALSVGVQLRCGCRVSRSHSRCLVEHRRRWTDTGATQSSWGPFIRLAWGFGYDLWPDVGVETPGIRRIQSIRRRADRARRHCPMLRSRQPVDLATDAAPLRPSHQVKGHRASCWR